MLVQTSRPPMGWNSWNGYLGSPDQEELFATMRYMAQHLLPYGYEYAVTDARWYQYDEDSDEPSEAYPVPHVNFDEYGRLWPHPEKYPLCRDGSGFTHITEYAHDLGLKFGLHMMRGTFNSVLGKGFTVKGTDTKLDEIIDLSSGCTWSARTFGLKTDHPASQAYYDSIFELFAQWGIDFVKYDDIASPIHREEIEMIHKAIDKCGRDIALSLSPGNWTERADGDFYAKHSTMWRISQDFWDDWDENMRESFDLLALWNDHLGKPGWPDADMIPIGWLCEHPSVRGMLPRLTRFNVTEQQALFTLFSIARSPLMLTCNLNRNDDHLLQVQTQPDCIAVNQRGEGNRVVQCGKDNDLHLWRAKADGHDYLACFHLNKNEEECTFPVPSDLQGKKGFEVWNGRVIPALGETLTIPMTAHSVWFIRLN